MSLERTTNFESDEFAFATDMEAEFNNYLAYINDCIHSDGTVHMNANLTFDNTPSPSIILDAVGQEVDGQKWRIMEDGGDFYIQRHNGEEYEDVLVAAFGTDNVTLNNVTALLLELTGDYPYIKFDGVESGGAIWYIKENAGKLEFLKGAVKHLVLKEDGFIGKQQLDLEELGAGAPTGVTAPHEFNVDHAFDTAGGAISNMYYVDVHDVARTGGSGAYSITVSVIRVGTLSDDAEDNKVRVRFRVEITGTVPGWQFQYNLYAMRTNATW